jgi:hypothetical protein
MPQTRKIRIKRAPKIKHYSVTSSAELQETGKRQEHSTPKQRRAKQSVANAIRLRTPSRTRSALSKRKVINAAAAHLYAKAVHEANSLRGMLKVVDTSDHALPVRKYVVEQLRKNFKNM